MDEAREKASRADVYLSSTNALTEEGKLVNIDGLGNRVASMIYGPKKVYILCGINKITKNLDEALQRIKDNTYKNARRLKLETPCAYTEKCTDCSSPQRMCSVTTIIERRPYKTDFEVIIIGQELGY
jgi:NAD-dependent dihydropyrimidine dehydrogenase PreA subunit